MSNVNAAYFKKAVPEYGSSALIADADTTFILRKALAEAGVDATIWLTFTDIAVCMLMAHWYKMDERVGQGGVVTSDRTGSWARSYAVSGAGDEELNDTSYGREFIRIRKTLPIGFFIV